MWKGTFEIIFVWEVGLMVLSYVQNLACQIGRWPNKPMGFQRVLLSKRLL